MENSLTVIPEQRDFFRGDAEPFAGGERGFGVDFAEAEIELAEVGRVNGSLFGDAKDFFADFRREVDARVIEELRVEVWRRAGHSC